jgi:CheY-like chemotaxis protein
VLVADDDPDVRESLRLILEDAGYGVVEAADGIAALDALYMNVVPFIVLLDVLLPHMSGYEVLLHVAADPVLRTRHAYCLLTAVQLTDERIGPRFNDLITRLDGAILSKPFDLETLLACVADLWARLQAREQPRKLETADAETDNGQEDAEDREGAATA